MSFASMKKNRGKARKALNSKIKKQASEENTGNRFVDERFWTYKADEAGSVTVTLRFLPLWDGADEAEDQPWVKQLSHSFKGAGGEWFINNCPKTLGDETPCPVCEYNKEITASYGGWDKVPGDVKAGLFSGGEVGRAKRTQYIANIMVVKDPSNPENNGKTFLWKFGPQILGIILGVMNPEVDDDDPDSNVDPLDPFDFWDGNNFVLRVRQKEKRTTYLSSTFSDVSPLFDDDKKIESTWKALHNLSELVDPSTIETYENLNKRMNKVLKLSNESEDTPTDTVDEKSAGKSDDEDTLEDDDIPFDSDDAPTADADLAGDDDFYDNLLED